MVITIGLVIIACAALAVLRRVDVRLVLTLAALALALDVGLADALAQLSGWRHGRRRGRPPRRAGRPGASAGPRGPRFPCHLSRREVRRADLHVDGLRPRAARDGLRQAPGRAAGQAAATFPAAGPAGRRAGGFRSQRSAHQPGQYGGSLGHRADSTGPGGRAVTHRHGGRPGPGLLDRRRIAQSGRSGAAEHRRIAARANAGIDQRRLPVPVAR